MKVRWSWLSLPLLTTVVACASIIGFNDLQKVSDSTTEDGGTGSTTPPDTTTNADGSTTPTNPDASSTVCNSSTPWGAPVALAPVNSANTERIASLSADELTIVFQNSQGRSNTNIMLATRTAKTAAFGAPTTLTTLKSGNGNFEPSLSSDGLTLFWDAFDSSNQFIVLYRATRAATTAAFGSTVQMPNVTATNMDTLSPVISADGAELFMLRATPPNGTRAIFHAFKNGTEFAAPTAMDGLASSVTGDVDALAISADRLTLYFSSDRAGGLGQVDIWMTSRSSTTTAFMTPALVTALNTASVDDVGWVSADNCRLYMSSDRGGNDDIYLASRSPQ